MQPLSITAYTLTNALGTGNEASLSSIIHHRGGLRANDIPGSTLETWIGKVASLDSVVLADSELAFDCRNNRLALLTLQQDQFQEKVKEAINLYGAHRIGLFLGTSTSGVRETEKAFQYRQSNNAHLPEEFSYWHSQNVYSVGRYVRQHLKLKGPAEVISTACSSSAKTFATASRFIQAGFCDAAIVGGVDTLCEMTLYGFHSLQLVSVNPCKPFDADRDGISIGEAAGFALLEKSNQGNELSLLGYGESSDAYHISSPHPEGLGAASAMTDAVQRAALKPAHVDYINLHGTSTPANDASEGKAVVKALGTNTACSSTKGWTGHTLGAAGITEAIFCLLALENNILPGSLNTETLDQNIELNYQKITEQKSLDYVMSNSFGFGGSNCSLLFGRSA